MCYRKCCKKFWDIFKSDWYSRDTVALYQLTGIIWPTKICELISEIVVNFTELIHMLKSLYYLELCTIQREVTREG